MSLKRILLTGYGGFLGNHLFSRLRNHSKEFYTLGTTSNFIEYHHYEPDKINDIDYLDITKIKSIRSIMGFYKPDIIINLAAKSTPGLLDWNQTWDVNVNGVKNLLENAPERCRFIQASSITVYGTSKTERAFRESDSTNPTSIYAASKIAAESLVNSYTNLGLVKGVNLRFGAILGSGLTHGVVHDFTQRVKKDDFSGILEILGDYPGSRKPYIHVDDCISAILKCIDNDNVSSYNITIGDNCSILDIAEMIQKHSEKVTELKWLGESANFKGDNRTVLCCNHKASSELDWNPQISTSLEVVDKCIKEIFCG